MERVKSNAREFAARAQARLASWRTGFAASRAGTKWAALPPRTQRLIAGGGCGVLVLALVAGLVLGPLSGHGSGGSAATPGVAAASSFKLGTVSVWTPAVAASVSPSASASASPTPWTPDDGVSPRTADTLVTIGDCTPDATDPVSSGGRLYVSCNKGAKIIAIDLATDKVAMTYNLDGARSKAAPAMIAVDHGLWVSLNAADATSLGPTDTDDTTTVERLDLTTGKTTAQFKGSKFVEDVSGSLWMYDDNGDLNKVKASSAKKSIWKSGSVDDALSYAYSAVACGYVWTTSLPTSAKSLSYFIRLDPATGAKKNIAPTNAKHQAVEVIEWAGTCWGVVGVPSCSNCASEKAQLERLGPSCIDMVTSQIGTIGFDTPIYTLGNTLWMGDGDDVNQVEPFGGKVGRTWHLPTTSTSWIVDTNGQVWVAGDNGLMRMNIPLDKMSPGPTPATLTCPGAAPTASPSASASPSPSPTPTDTPVATDTPAPSDSPDTSVIP